MTNKRLFSLQVSFSDLVPIFTLPSSKFLQDLSFELIQNFINVSHVNYYVSPGFCSSIVSLANHMSLCEAGDKAANQTHTVLALMMDKTYTNELYT